MASVSNLPPPPPPGPPPPPQLQQPYAGQAWGQAPVPGGWQRTGQPPAQLSGPYHSIGLVILLSVVTCGIWTFVWSYRTGEELQRYNGDGLGGGLTLLLAVVVSPAVMFTIPGEIETMYQRDGRQSPVGALLGLWFLLPLIGNIIWYVKVQQALNDFWLSKGTRPAN